jgi:hypothetical protein
MRHYRQRWAILMPQCCDRQLGPRWEARQIAELEYLGLGRGGDRCGRLDTATLDLEVGERFCRPLARRDERSSALGRSATMRATEFARSGCAAEGEAMPLRYAAELLGMGTDREGDPVADRPHGALLRSARIASDSRGVGAAIIGARGLR